MGNLRDTVEEVTEIIQDSSKDIVEDSKDEIQNVVDKIKDRANMTGGEDKSSFKDQVKDEIQDGLDQIEEQAKDRLQDMADDAKDEIKDFDTDFGDETVFSLALKGGRVENWHEATAAQSHVVGYAAAGVCAFGLALVLANKKCNKVDSDFQRA